MFCVYTYLLQKDTQTVAISFGCMSNSLRKTENIQMILQLSECLSAAEVCEQNTLPMCDFMFMQHSKWVYPTRLVNSL